MDIDEKYEKGPTIGTFSEEPIGYPKHIDSDTKGGRDLATTEPIGKELDILFENESTGMPLYFKDLRDGSYIIFRGYVEGITEDLSPNWEEETYIGRSEPVHIYTGANRTVDFTLMLAAQTKAELHAIYHKLNRLTSLCYPEYAEDPNITVNGTGKMRMKPPIVRFRLGELYGAETLTDNKPKELLGFLKSLSYTFPDESTWEIERGKRVPKTISAAIGFQVIHDEVPSLTFAQEGATQAFYGINQPVDKLGVGIQ